MCGRKRVARKGVRGGREEGDLVSLDLGGSAVSKESRGSYKGRGKGG